VVRVALDWALILAELIGSLLWDMLFAMAAEGSVTPGFKIKVRCLSYVYPGSSCHTYGQNVNTENQCLYYINFITQILSL
jgi:hypothetical protein